jgi:hypothetical protein
MTPVPAQIMHLSASRRFPLLSTGQRRGTARSTEKTRRHGRLFPAPHRFASQDGTIFETHNRDDRLVGLFSTDFEQLADHHGSRMAANCK